MPAIKCVSAIFSHLIQKRKIGSCRDFAEVDQGFSRTSLVNWEIREMQAIMKAGWRIWPQQSDVFHVKEDGARLGQPGKETSVMKITFGGSMLSLFAVPMELGVKI